MISPTFLPAVPARAADPESAPRPGRWPAVLFAVAAAVAATWIVVAVRAAGHGFDVTDEGFYLLSYRWWNVDHRNFTGVQYLYGPVFQLVGHDIAMLRLFRLVTVVGVHLVLGWSFMRWLRPRRPCAPPARTWEAAGVAAIVAAGGAVYGWLPPTPGYNDVVLLGSLLAVAIVLRAATYAERADRIPFWLPASLSPVIVAMLLAKWASGVVVLVIVVAGVVAISPYGARPVARAAAWMLGGLAVALAFVQLFVVSLAVALPPLIEVNRFLATRSLTIGALLSTYADTIARPARWLLEMHGLLLLAAAVAVLARRPAVRIAAWVLAAAGLALSVVNAVQRGGLGGGAAHVALYLVPLLVLPAFAVVTGVARVVRERPVLDRRRLRAWFLLGVLLLVPAVQAAGTAGPPLQLAVNGLGAWMAVLIAVVTGPAIPSGAARWLSVAVPVAVLLATVSIAIGGLWRYPYRTVAGSESTAAAGVPALASVTLDPAAASRIGALRRLLEPYVRAPGRPIMAFDKMPGVVFALDGRSVGEPWYPYSDRPRVMAGIEADCRDGRLAPGTPAPILLFDRPVRPAELSVFERCGLDLDGYRRVAPSAGTMDLTVYVPVADVVR